MALMGAELFLFPTAIGSEPPPALPVNSREHWQRTQQGHAAANLIPLIAANRYGLERSLQDPKGLYIRFYGSSFIADAMGAKVAEAGEEGDAVLTYTFDLNAVAPAARQLVRVPRPPPGPVRAAGVPRRHSPQRRLRLRSVEPAQQRHEFGRPAPHLGGDVRLAAAVRGLQRCDLAGDHDLAALVEVNSTPSPGARRSTLRTCGGRVTWPRIVILVAMGAGGLRV